MSTKPEGWFSRRHPTCEAHDRARAEYLANRGPVARRRRATERARARRFHRMNTNMSRFAAAISGAPFQSAVAATTAVFKALVDGFERARRIEAERSVVRRGR